MGRAGRGRLTDRGSSLWNRAHNTQRAVSVASGTPQSFLSHSLGESLPPLIVPPLPLFPLLHCCPLISILHTAVAAQEGTATTEAVAWAVGARCPATQLSPQAHPKPRTNWSTGVTESDIWLVLLFGVLTAEDGEEHTPTPVTAGGTHGTPKGLHSLRCPRVKESLVYDCEEEAGAIEKGKEGEETKRLRDCP